MANQKLASGAQAQTIQCPDCDGRGMRPDSSGAMAYCNSCRTSGRVATLKPHAVKKLGRYLPATKRAQTAPPFNIGRQTVSIIRGRSFMTRDEALRCAQRAIDRACSAGGTSNGR